MGVADATIEASFCEAIQLNKLSTHRTKETRWPGACGGHRQFAEGVYGTGRAGHTPKQTWVARLGLAVETDLPRPPWSWGSRLPVVQGCG
jgi:hypothetical protein